MSRGDRIFKVVFSVVLIIAGIVLLIGMITSDPRPSPSSSPCERSWDEYVANGRPNNMSHSQYIASCKAGLRAVREAENSK